MPPTPLEAPSYVLWEITRTCNLRCVHCAASAGRPRLGELTSQEALRLCDDLAELGTAAVCLMGGEPLLRADWPQLAGRLRERHVEVGLITNGLAFDREVVRTVENLGICQVGTSLDAANAELHDRLRNRRGAHARAQTAIRLIRDMNLVYRTVITSVSGNNLGELPTLADWLAEHASGFTWMINISSCHDPQRFAWSQPLDERGFLEVARFIHHKRAELCGRLTVTATHDLGYFSRSMSDLHDFEWHGCVAGLETLGIRSNGDLVGCLVMDDSFVEANVRQRSVASLWGDPSAFAYNRRFSVDMLEGACRGCDKGKVCRGGCRDHAVSFTGSRFHYPFCLYRMER
jgi:radical SAM protein with 4Fe4S-binding SPASM domain